jgi:O-6-methylguanine DNA methyltransferase
MKSMRDYSKVGGKKGMPGYRTSSMFRNKILRIVAKIPQGTVLTYKEVAKRAGNLKASRAVGNILNKNCDPKIPCHRVIRNDGEIGGYNRGGRKKRELLKEEGFIV